MKHKVFAALVAGCGLLAASMASAQSAGAVPGTPTFSKDVAPIFYKNCTSCHRPGEIAPMSLLTYASVRPYVRAIGTQVGRGAMPPWHADPAHGQFANDRRLSPVEKQTIQNWVNAGAPEGNVADLPPQPVYPGGWNIGQPDAVFSLAEDYAIPANGTIDYKHFEVATTFTEDKWIQAFEVKPGAPGMVHHIIVYARAPRRAPEAGAPPPAAATTSAPQAPQRPLHLRRGDEPARRRAHERRATGHAERSACPCCRTRRICR